MSSQAYLSHHIRKMSSEMFYRQLTDCAHTPIGKGKEEIHVEPQ